jgi:hypothetical protein
MPEAGVVDRVAEYGDELGGVTVGLAAVSQVCESRVSTTST